MPSIARFVFSFLLVMTLFAGGMTDCAAADRKVIGFADFQTGSDIDASLPALITNKLVEKIVTNRSYQVADQAVMKQRLSAAGLSASVYEQSINLEPEQLAGMHFLVTGIINEASISHVQLNGFQQLRARVKLNVRVVHAPALQVVYAESILGEASRTFLLERAGMDTDSTFVRKTLLETAAISAVEKISAKLHSLNPMTGVVLQVRPADKTVVLDLGTEHGVAAGQYYKLYTEGEVLVHPASNLEVGKEKKQVATVQITAADALNSIAKLTIGSMTDIQPGMLAVKLPLTGL